jgi:hypothetical protein
VHYVCARCHLAFSAAAEGDLACPRCKAEAGLEPVHGVPLPMKLFGLALTFVLVLAVGGGLLGRLLG